VVIGFDARHGSRNFALDTAAVVVAAGGEAELLPGPNPTPLLAFGVRALGADAGVMVTASHNPAQDNGYKVYLGGRVAPGAGDGVQLVPPADAQIAAHIAAAPPAAQVPRAAGGWSQLGPELADSYVAKALEADGATRAEASARAALRIVNTSLHGVGASLALRCFEAAGFTDVHPVAAQQEPDPDFPTVAFPNPEEPGAIDLAVEAARREGADIVIAHDPDADRCAVAVPDPYLGDWRMLTGDELGALLGEQAARAWSARLEQTPDARAADGAPPVLACSIVSSGLLAQIAEAYGLGFAHTLTGFKWIARTPGLAFGYEEAIGYCTRPDMVRDKDGITAGLAVARLAAAVKAQGGTLIGVLDQLARTHGLHLTGQVALRFDRPEAIAATVARIVAAPPTQLADQPVVRAVNLADGFEGLPPTPGIGLWTAGGSRVVIRPSGTEPKVKCYLEVVRPVPAGADAGVMAHERAAAKLQLDELAAAVRGLLAA
jgi:phosphomannomutase